jgi:hypothetical protein
VTAGPAADALEPDPVALPLGRAARLVGAYRWCEHHLFEVTGAAALAPGDAVPPEVRVLLDGVSGRHAWHAELFADRLPLVAHLDPDALSVPLPAMAAAAVSLDSAVQETDPSGRPAAVLVGLAQVFLPRLLATYRAHRAVTVAVTDGPTMRVLDLVIDDEAGEADTAQRLVAAGLEAGWAGFAAGDSVTGPADGAVRAAGAVTGFLQSGDLATL